MCNTYFITSGKGGVGKSTLTASLALTLAQAGHSVTVIDMDIGLRGQDALLGLENQVVYDIVDVVEGTCPLSDALLTVQDTPTLLLLPAAQFARAKALNAKELRKLIRALRKENDFLFIDCPAGVERGFRNVSGTGISEAILVVTPDDLCLRDGERVLSLLREAGIDHPRLVVNRLRTDLIAAGEMYTAETVSQVLDCPLLGEIPEDDTVYRAQLRHAPLTNYACPARDAVRRVARRLTGEEVPFPRFGAKKPTLWQRLFPKTLPALREVTPLDRH